MSLPRVAPYPLPGSGDLPGNKVSWRLAKSRAVLLVHDMQQYFVNAFPAGAAPVSPVISNITRLSAACRALGLPVVYTVQPPRQEPSERGLLMDFWGPGIGAEPGDEVIVPELRPGAADHVVTKMRYSAFYGTPLREMLRMWNRDQLLVSGIYAHLGCLLTAADAFMSDIQPFFVADAVADFSSDHHEMALRYASSRCAMIVTTDEAARWIAGEPHGLAS